MVNNNKKNKFKDIFGYFCCLALSFLIVSRLSTTDVSASKKEVAIAMHAAAMINPAAGFIIYMTPILDKYIK